MATRASGRWCAMAAKPMRLQEWGLVRRLDYSKGLQLWMIGGRYVLAPWEQGGPVVTKPTHWAVVNGLGIRIPGWLYRWLSD
jgi:hypothetical protein